MNAKLTNDTLVGMGKLWLIAMSVFVMLGCAGHVGDSSSLSRYEKLNQKHIKTVKALHRAYTQVNDGRSQRYRLEMRLQRMEQERSSLKQALADDIDDGCGLDPAMCRAELKRFKLEDAVRTAELEEQRKRMVTVLLGMDSQGDASVAPTSDAKMTADNAADAGASTKAKAATQP